MKKTISLLLLILLNISCSSEFKTIDKNVSQVENVASIQKVCFDCISEVDALVYYFIIENQIKKISFEIDSKNDCKEYNQKCTVYLEDNVPILITEITSGICEDEISGVDVGTNEFKSFKEEFKISNSVKIYIEDWEQFEIAVSGGNKFDYSLKTKEKYQKILTKVLEQEKRK